MMKRFTWEDALIDAQAAGEIGNGALLVALKLSKAINWSPKKHKQPGLYWKNDDALKSVGCGRSTYFKYRAELFEAGFFMEVKGNLIPRLPEQSTVETEQSTVWTEESTVETTESTLETEESIGEHPFSVDTFSEDVCSVDDVVTDSADAPSVDTNDKDDGLPLSNEETDSPLSPQDGEPGLSESVEGSAESTPWTVEEDPAAKAQSLGIEYTYNCYLAASKIKPKEALVLAMKKEGITL